MSFEQEARRARLRAACQYLAGDIDRDAYVEAIASSLEMRPFGAHTGWWHNHKHPFDQAAEIEEEWRFPAA